MKSNILEKMDGFARRHPLLSSYLYLLMISDILEFFGLYTDMAQSYSVGRERGHKHHYFGRLTFHSHFLDNTGFFYFPVTSSFLEKEKLP